MKKWSAVRIRSRNGLFEWQRVEGDEETMILNDFNGGEIVFMETLDLTCCRTVADIVARMAETAADAFVFFVTPPTRKLYGCLTDAYRQLVDARTIYWIDETGVPAKNVECAAPIACCALEDALDDLNGRTADKARIVGRGAGEAGRPSAAETPVTAFLCGAPGSQRPSGRVPAATVLAESERADDEAAMADIMMNGMKLLWSGKYARSFASAGTHHVYLDEGVSVRRADIEQLASLNSAVILAPGSTVEDGGRTFMHLHRLENDTVWVDETVERALPPVLGYETFRNGRCLYSPDDQPIVTIDSDADLAAFAADLAEFRQSGTIRSPFFLLRNECRFSNCCTLQEQPRLFIRQGLGVDPCGDAAEPLYPLSSPVFEQQRLRRRLIETAQIDRQCRLCAARDYCTGCSRLPAFLEEKTYCAFLREHPELPDFFNVKTALMLLLSLTKTFGAASPADFRFSFSGQRLTYERDAPAGQIDQSNVHLFRHRGQYYAFSPLSAVLARLNERTTLLIESHKDQLDGETTRALLESRYGEPIGRDELKHVYSSLQPFLG